jgi:signal peptidase I
VSHSATAILIVTAVVVVVVPVGTWPLAYVAVRGDSMEPTVSSGDVVVLVSGTEYRPGEVVAYRVPEMGGAVILHRIIDRVDDLDERPDVSAVSTRYVLRGDNNAFEDRHRPTSSQIIGRSAATISTPWSTLAVSPTARVVVLAVLLAAMTALVTTTSVRDGWRRRRWRRAGRSRCGAARRAAVGP